MIIYTKDRKVIQHTVCEVGYLKKLKLIYNPNSGNKSFKDDLDICLSVFQRGGYDTHIFRSMEPNDIYGHLSKCNIKDYDTIVVSGGDGTINNVVNFIMVNNINISFGIIPSGTANDFATFLNIPASTEEACKIIVEGNTMYTDICRANDMYFINVVAVGLFTNVSQNMNLDHKHNFGKLAYYIDGAKQLPNFEPLRIKITNSKESIEEEFYIVIALNTSGAGGFKKLSVDARLDDGLLDFVGFKTNSKLGFAKLFIKVLSGEFLDDPSVVFFRDKEIEIEIISKDVKPIYLTCDMDGEIGPKLPVKIKNIPKAIKLFIPKKEGE
jgi:diacylglycerol kinase (ATP)